MERNREKITYSFVANHRETMEALAKSRLSGREFRLVILILNQTDGYLREEDQLKPAFIAERTGIPRSHIPHVLKRLRQWKIVWNEGRTYGLNPPSTWDKQVLTKNGEKPKTAKTLAENGETLAENGEKQLCTKENLLKKNLKKTGSVSTETSPSLETEKRKVIKELQERRGYRSGRPAAEAKAISQMLKEGYLAAEQLQCYDAMKSEEYWRDRPLFMMTVRAQIGEYKKRGFQPIPPRAFGQKDNGQRGERRVAATRTMEDFATGSW